MLLRESSKAVEQEVDLDSTVGGQGSELVPAGQQLADFGKAVTLGSKDIGIKRAALKAILSEEAFNEASAIAAIFNGLVRTADATGIPLDEKTKIVSKDFRENLGLNVFPGAINTLRLNA